MKRLDNNQKIFFELLKAGLWEKEVWLASYKEIDFEDVYRLAEEQSVVGLVTAGLDQVKDVIVPQKWSLQFIGSTLQLEQFNKAMNSFIAEWLQKLQNVKINPLLIKGQGVAQCYERPFWRSCGDIDLLLDQQEYLMARTLLIPYSQSEPKETESTKEYCLTIDGFAVELHGTLHCRLTKKLDKFLDRIQDESCNRGAVRTWNVEGKDVLLPSVDNDVFVIFTHIVKHFFREGVGLRQLCDWCRLMWTFRNEIDKALLEDRLIEAGILSEWKAFATLAVEYLGMPVDAMPLYSISWCWKRKAKRILRFVIETGNFGQNRDFSYSENKPKPVVKAISLWRHTWDLSRQFFIFPIDSLIVWGSMLKIGIDQVRKEKVVK